MARVRFQFEGSDAHVSGPMSIERAETFLHLLYVKVLKVNMDKVKKYTGLPQNHICPSNQNNENIPQHIKSRTPDLPKIPSALGLVDYGVKIAQTISLRNQNDTNIIYGEVI